MENGKKQGGALPSHSHLLCVFRAGRAQGWGPGSGVGHCLRWKERGEKGVSKG